MMFVRRLRVEATADVQTWTLLAMLAAVDRLGDDANPTALARELDARSSNIAAGLRDAEKRGHLTRAHDPHDRRRTHVLLTRQGRDTLDAARNQRSQWLSAAVSELTADEQRTLSAAGELLERLATTPTAPPSVK
ncbi:MarR family transcriptional regulator [Sphingomonas sp. PAMC26645]|uniref:MarR family winged helix-turn-helix transcriptional regulator n=1 Tax=Sphingomonas sp. PAMC26645 TaxID=2565555 RepID=UPI00109E2F60|nr:MarR family transcriptional regulator [Sphingomonas sp. PAMC26645]QCB43273.1 MarR family transcriptional regulator [Sphingomonas sp. PAMC26645]